MPVLLAIWMSLSAFFFQTDYFFPINNRNHPVSRNAAGISEAEFFGAIDSVMEFYEPFIQEHYGKTLEIFGDWENGTVNAYVRPTATGFYIHMYGGLARDPLTTLEGFYLVILHEIGHAIGGAPKYKRWGSSWASSEGQSDYYATAKGGKLIFQNQPETIQIYDQADPEMKAVCDAQFDNTDEAATCVRSILGGISLGSLLGSFSNSKVFWDKPDPIVVTVTNYDGYPRAQCRLDTYVRGALCDADQFELASTTDATTGYCNGESAGSRPKCWYAE